MKISDYILSASNDVENECSLAPCGRKRGQARRQYSKFTYALSITEGREERSESVSLGAIKNGEQKKMEFSHEFRRLPF